MDSSPPAGQHSSASRSDDRSHSPTGEPNVLGNVIGRDITAFGRTVTATASHLIAPFDGAHPTNQYASAMGDLSKQLSKRPSLQKRMLSMNRTPTELMRSKLLTTEIQHRALTHVPDELLQNVPDHDHAYSLFQGFQATVPEDSGDESGKKHHHHKHRRRDRDGKHKQLEHGPNGAPPGPPSLEQMDREKVALKRQLELLAIRKNMASSEIREIDQKISNLHHMRDIVFDRLAKLEQDEAEIEHEIISVENKMEDLEDELELAGIGEEQPRQTSTDDGSNADDTPGEEGFMSESIYGKLPQQKKLRKRRGTRRINTPVLHSHLQPGHNIREIQTHGDTITALDFDVPFGTMVTASLDDSVRVWDLNNGRCYGSLEGHNASVRCLQVEDNIVATGSADASIRIWDLSKAETFKYSACGEDEDTPDIPTESLADCHVMTLGSHVDEVTALYFQGDTLVSGSADKTLRQWDLVKGRCVQTLDVLWAAAQSSMDEGKWRSTSARTPDPGDFIGALQCFDAALACGTADGMVRLWDLRSGQVHRSLVGHTGAVTALQFDDVHLVTGSLDRSIRIWDLRTGTIYDAYGYENPVTSMQFDTRRIVSAAGVNVAKIYDKTDGRHWDCGAGTREDSINAAIVDRIRVKDGYLVEGRRDASAAPPPPKAPPPPQTSAKPTPESESEDLPQITLDASARYEGKDIETVKANFNRGQAYSLLAGERAIDVKDFEKRRPRREGDPFHINYVSDFTKIDPVLDFAAPINLTQDPSLQLDPYQELPVINDPNLFFQKEKAISDERTDRLMKTGARAGTHSNNAGNITAKAMVVHSVTNQTRMGKIRKMYVLAIAGNENGLLGIGEGKSMEAEDAREAAIINAIRNLQPIQRYENRTTFGNIDIKNGAVEMEIMSRPPGFGIRCSHLIFEMARLAGIKDLQVRVTRSRNPMNVIKTFMMALQKQRLPEEIARGRGKKLVDVRNVYYSGRISNDGQSAWKTGRV